MVKKDKMKEIVGAFICVKYYICGWKRDLKAQVHSTLIDELTYFITKEVFEKLANLIIF